VFQRITLVLLALFALNIAYAQVAGGSPSWSLATLAVLLGMLAFRKRILWRVRNRLLITYFLFGVVPIFLLGILLMFSVELVLGRFAAERVREGLDARTESVHGAAQDLAVAASRGSKPELLNEIRRRVPGLAAEVHVNGEIVLEEGDAALPAAALQATFGAIGPGFQGVFESAGQYSIAAKVRAGVGNAEVVASLPLNEETLTSLTDGVVTVAGVFSGDDDINMHFGGDSEITVMSHGNRQEIAPKGLRPPRGSWDRIIGGLLSEQVQTSSGTATQAVFIVFARLSQLAAGVLMGRMATIILGVLVIVAGFFLIVEIGSLVFSLSLKRTITRSVHDLYQGTVQVAAGSFTEQIPVRGEHQLSELASSFNSMISRIGHLMGEVRKKEKIEAELEIARQVQARLFPRSVPELKTLELAGTCIPGRFVSGDYYDFFRLDDRQTAIALGDVSGKGVSAALLMASIQSALHAQLKFSGERAGPSFSAEVLMG
jgi:sigma-B regulation protein RsbU (phosphoserine phosphatase)